MLGGPDYGGLEVWQQWAIVFWFVAMFSTIGWVVWVSA